MLLSYHINLVKFKMLWLSKILQMAYNLRWREYFVTLTPCMLLSIKLVRITFYTDRMQQKSDPLHLLAWCLDEPLPVVPTLIFTFADLCCAHFNWAIDYDREKWRRVRTWCILHCMVQIEVVCCQTPSGDLPAGCRALAGSIGWR